MTMSSSAIAELMGNHTEVPLGYESVDMGVASNQP